MLAQEPTLKPGLYRLPEDPVASRILIPGFRAATVVEGAFGWFSAGWIELLAPGLAEHLNRREARPIKFTVSPHHFPAEIQAMKRAQRTSPDEAQERVAEVFIEGRVRASAPVRRGCAFPIGWSGKRDAIHTRRRRSTPGKEGLCRSGERSAWQPAQAKP